MDLLIDFLFLINLAFVFISGYVAYTCFEDGRTNAGYFNLFASALNGAVFANHFF